MYEVIKRVTDVVGITFRIQDNEIQLMTIDGRRIIRKLVQRMEATRDTRRGFFGEGRPRGRVSRAASFLTFAD